MADYDAWKDLCESIIRDIYEIVKKLNTDLTHKQQIEYRKLYVEKCEEWLNANEFMVDIIKKNRERIMINLSILK